MGTGSGLSHLQFQQLFLQQQASLGQLGPHTTGMSGGAVGCSCTLRGQMPSLFGVFTQVGEADE